jgi:hypothetical protein
MFSAKSKIVYSCDKLLLSPKNPISVLSHLASTDWLGD